MQGLVDVLVIGVAYLLGSIPFGLLLAKWQGYGDIREQGSGNIGATNVLRNADKATAFMTLFLDGFKGALAVIIAQELMQPHTAPIAGIAAVLGHMYPIWLNFKGGKGVATTLAVFLVTDSALAIFACLAWILTFYVARISSLSAIIALCMTTIFALYFSSGPVFWMVFLLSAFVISRHKENIIRLLRGEEKPITKKKGGDSTENNDSESA